MKRNLLAFSVIVALAFSSLIATSAFAVPCGIGYLTTSTACADGPAGVVNDSAGVLNAGAFFGINTWEELSKDEGGGNISGNIDLTVVSVGSPSGTWSFNPNVWNNYTSIAIALKDGNYLGNAGPPSIWWSAYLLAPDISSGTWDFGWDKELSHFTVYGDPAPIPEPATMLLFGTGLAGLAGFARKRKAQQN